MSLEMAIFNNPKLIMTAVKSIIILTTGNIRPAFAHFCVHYLI